MACLDTDVLIDLLSRRAARARKAERAVVRLIEADETVATTRFNVAELLIGAHRSSDPPREAGRIGRVLAGMEIVEFDAAAADHFGALMAGLLARGRPIGDLDVLIAATAMANGHAVLAGNMRHYREIPGLPVIGYE